jgi:hypothetical protein
MQIAQAISENGWRFGGQTGLPLATARELRDLVQYLKAEELRLLSAAEAVAQEAAAAKKTAEEGPKKNV